MAVIDDLAAIALIAVLFTGEIGWAVAAIIPFVVSGALLRSGRSPGAVLLAIAASVCVHATGPQASAAILVMAVTAACCALISRCVIGSAGGSGSRSAWGARRYPTGRWRSRAACSGRA